MALLLRRPFVSVLADPASSIIRTLSFLLRRWFRMLCIGFNLVALRVVQIHLDAQTPTGQQNIVKGTH